VASEGTRAAIAPACEPTALVTMVELTGRVDRSDVARLFGEFEELLGHHRRGPVLCDVGACWCPNLATVDALARFRLLTRRTDRQIFLINPGRELRELIAFAGLERSLPALRQPGPILRLRAQPERKSHHREQPLGIQEEGDLLDHAPFQFEHLDRPGLVSPALWIGFVLSESRRIVHL
jgi:hypothetical protein